MVALHQTVAVSVVPLQLTGQVDAYVVADRHQASVGPRRVVQTATFWAGLLRAVAYLAPLLLKGPRHGG